MRVAEFIFVFLVIAGLINKVDRTSFKKDPGAHIAVLFVLTFIICWGIFAVQHRLYSYFSGFDTVDEMDAADLQGVHDPIQWREMLADNIRRQAEAQQKAREEENIAKQKQLAYQEEQRRLVEERKADLEQKRAAWQSEIEFDSYLGVCLSDQFDKLCKDKLIAFEGMVTGVHGDHISVKVLGAGGKSNSFDVALENSQDAFTSGLSGSRVKFSGQLVNWHSFSGDEVGKGRFVIEKSAAQIADEEAEVKRAREAEVALAKAVAASEANAQAERERLAAEKERAAEEARALPPQRQGRDWSTLCLEVPAFAKTCDISAKWTSPSDGIARTFWVSFSKKFSDTDLTILVAVSRDEKVQRNKAELIVDGRKKFLLSGHTPSTSKEFDADNALSRSILKSFLSGKKIQVHFDGSSAEFPLAEFKDFFEGEKSFLAISPTKSN